MEVEKVVEKPEIIITIVDGDGESVVYPEWFEKKYYFPSYSWSDYQGWLAKFLEEHYHEVGSVYIEDRDMTVTVYKLKK